VIKVSITTDWECLSPSPDGFAKVLPVAQMIIPAITLASLAEKYNIRISYFLEISQWIKFKHTPDYKEYYLKISELAKELYLRGHDIQIHGHSEWITAKYINGSWVRAFSGPDMVHQVMPQFILTLEEAIYDLQLLLGGTYRANVYRAGGYNVEPFAELYNVLTRFGIFADSSRHEKKPFSSFCEKDSEIISLPILGEFPTADQRWDMNLSPKTCSYLFGHTSCYGVKNKNAVMMGHTKQIHQWKPLEECFYKIMCDDYISPVTISCLALSSREELISKKKILN
jgi:hypothetical protein